MDNNSSPYTSQFDRLYTSNQIQILKTLMPFIEPDSQKRFAIFIKYMELKLSIEQLKDSKFIPFQKLSFTDNIDSIYSQLSPYLTPASQAAITNLKETFSSYKDMMDTMEMFKEMQATMSEEDMKDLFHQGMGLF